MKRRTTPPSLPLPPTHEALWSQLAMAVQDRAHPSVSYTTPSYRGAASSGYNVFAC